MVDRDVKELFYRLCCDRDTGSRDRQSSPMTSKHDARMFQKLMIISAWASILALAFATLTHVGFVYSIYYKLAPLLMRPGMRFYAHFEHVIAFAVFGALFAFAYPRRLIFVCSIVFVSAVALEYLQTLTPDRHGTLIDAIEKVVGGAFGILVAHAILWFTQSRRRFQT
jgi:VanZ family protein